MEKSRIIQCCPTDEIFLKCGCCCKEKYCSISYFCLKAFYAIFQMLFTLGLYYFDIVSDILVLVDLDKSNSEYFNLCLVMLLLPTFYSFVNMVDKQSVFDFDFDIKDISCCSKIVIIIEKLIVSSCLFLFNVLQLHVIIFACLTMKNSTGIDVDGIKMKYIDIRMTESLLESAPQSLFQLFLVLKNVTNYSYNQITIYYLSVTLSIISLIFSLVSYELVYFNNSRINHFVRYIHLTLKNKYKISSKYEYEYVKSYRNSKIGGININRLENSKIFDIRYSLLKINTPYIGLLFLFRLTEVLSRIGLLAVIGNIYDGYYIIIFLFCDFFIVTIANLCKSISYPKVCETKYEEYITATHETNTILNQLSQTDNCRSKSVIYCTHFIELIKLIFSANGFVSGVIFLIKQLKNLAVFNNYFCYYINNEAYSIIEKVQGENSSKVNASVEINSKIKNERQEVYKVILKNHFMFRYLNNLFLSIFIIYNLSVNIYSDSVFLISIGSMISFVSNIFFFGLITLYTRNYLKYEYIFRPITCCKCRCCYKKCGCKCCKKKDTNNQIDNINEERKIELEDICGKKKDEIETKHTDTIII